MRWTHLPLVLTLLFILTSVSAIIYKEDLTIDEEVKPSKAYYFPEEKVSASYEVFVNEKKVDELKRRKFEVCTELQVKEVYNEFIVKVWFSEGGGTNYPSKPEDVRYKDGRTCIAFTFPNLGISRFKVELSGTVPKVVNRTQEIYVLIFEVENVAEKALKNLTIRVVNRDVFHRDIQNYEAKIKELEKDLADFSKIYKATELEALLISIKKDFDRSKDYFYKGDYLNAAVFLDKVGEGISSYYKTKEKIISSDLISKASKILDESEELLDDIKMNLTILQREGKIDSVTHLRYIRIVERHEKNLKDFESKLNTIKTQYHDKELYDKAVKEMNSLLSEMNETVESLKSLNEEISLLFAVQPSIFEKVIKSQWIYVILAVAALAVVSILLIRRKRRRWDELK